MLIVPYPDLKTSYLDMVAEYARSGPLSRFHQMALDDFEGYLRSLDDISHGINLEPGFVQMDTFYLVLGDRVLGETRLRHQLTPDLMIEGGNIGYTIRPSERRKGYGTLALALTLEKARELGLSRVLITCDTDNTGSARIIEKNGGILAGRDVSPESGKLVSRYWIEI